MTGDRKNKENEGKFSIKKFGISFVFVYLTRLFQLFVVLTTNSFNGGGGMTTLFLHADFWHIFANF